MREHADRIENLQMVPVLCQPVELNPRVLFIIPGDGQGSSMIFVRRQSEALANEGIEAHLFYLGSRTSPHHLFSEYRRFRSELASLHPAVIHAHFGTVTALFAALASGFLPLVITYRGSDLNPPPKSYSWRAQARAILGSMFSQLAALRAQRIICVSLQLRDRLWWKRSVVTILPTGVDPTVFRPRSRALARQRLGWSDGERVVLFNAGNDVLVKRLDLARSSVEQARRDIPDLRLEILDGSTNPELLPEHDECSRLPAADQCFRGFANRDPGGVGLRSSHRQRSGRRYRRAPAGRERFNRRLCRSLCPRPCALVNILEPPRRSNGSSKVTEFSSVSSPAD